MWNDYVREKLAELDAAERARPAHSPPPHAPRARLLRRIGARLRRIGEWLEARAGAMDGDPPGTFEQRRT